MAASGIRHEEEDLLLSRRRRLCLSGAVGCDSSGGTRRERHRAPRVGPGDTHILRPREVLDCIDARSSAHATPAEGRRAAQEREARSETHFDAYAAIARCLSCASTALDKAARNVQSEVALRRVPCLDRTPSRRLFLVLRFCAGSGFAAAAGAARRTTRRAFACRGFGQRAKHPSVSKPPS